MRTYASTKEAGERLAKRFQKLQRLKSEDLLRFLEDLSSEPNGEHAYVLALALRGLGISEENLCQVAYEIDTGLSSLECRDSAPDRVRDGLKRVLRFVSDKHTGDQQSSKAGGCCITKGRAGVSAQGEPAIQEKNEAISAARECGHGVLRFIHQRYRRELFYSMAALALYWTIFEPSRTPGFTGDEMEQDVVRMFR